MALKKWGKGSKPPADYAIIAPVIEALENELRDKVKESNTNKRKTESMWPVLQIHNQRTRYIYDMFYTHGRISRKLYDYCIKHKIADGALIAKWKKPGYERLCSTYVINPQNYKFGTVSICRVPLKDRSEEQLTAQDPTTGCMGCASGKGAGPRNIFGNKYGQNLAAVQIARDNRMKAMQAKREESQKELQQQQQQQQQEEIDNERGGEYKTQAQNLQSHEKIDTSANSGDSETDDDSDDDDDYGPSPAAGVWAGSQKLTVIAENQGSGFENEDEEERPQKKLKAN